VYAVTEQCECSKLTPQYSFAECLDSLALALLSLLLFELLASCSNSWYRFQSEVRAYQSLHVAVKSMSVVSSELGVGTLKRRVTGSLGLLDSTRELAIARC
jgi:hypothetical protein